MAPSDYISILWVEDEPNEVYNHIKNLENIGFFIDIARSVQEAIQKAENEDYDVIITDLLMPPPDGIDFLRKLSPLNKPGIFTIAYTSYPYNNIYRQQIKQLPFTVEVIQKTDSTSELTLAIFKALAPRWTSLRKSRKKIWNKIVEAMEVKPGFGGVSIDVKRLLE